MTDTATASIDIMADGNADQREQVIELLKKAYWMEIETVMSYIANSVNPDGVRAQEIKESLEEDIQEELGHAQQFADADQGALRRRPRLARVRAPSSPTCSRPTEQVDVVHVIKGVIEAEQGAIEFYSRMIEETDGDRPGDPGHGDRDPPRRAGPQAPVRGLPARVRGRGTRLGAARRRRAARPGRAARGVDRAAELLPGAPGLGEQARALGGVGGRGAAGLEAGGRADRVAQPLGEARPPPRRPRARSPTRPRRRG